MIKKLLSSKILRIVISAVLIYFAFQRIDAKLLFSELSKVPIGFVLVNVLYSFVITVIGSYRWSLLLLKKPGMEGLTRFTKASYLGTFYSLFFPTGIAGDLLKWMPLKKNYPQIKKIDLFSSSLLDRVIGFTAFIHVAFAAAVVAKLIGIQFPDYLFWLFFFLCLAVVAFYVGVFYFNIGGIISKIPIIGKLSQIAELLKNENRKRIIKCLFVAFLSEFVWISQTWYISHVFGANFSWMSVFLFMPVIALILTLPISIAGFGAREQLYLFFFLQMGYDPVKILLVSTFLGLIGILNALIGGLFTLL